MRVFDFFCLGRGKGASVACVLLLAGGGGPACHNQIPPPPHTPPPGHVPAPKTDNKPKGNVFDPALTWSGVINISNSSAYQKVLEGFNVCGGPGWRIGVNILAASVTDYRSCKHWFGQARVRLNFLKKDLPAKARLLIYPSMSLNRRRQGRGSMFLQGSVKKINDSEGFTGDLYGGRSAFAVYVTSQRSTPEDNDLILHTTFGIDPYTNFGRTALKNEAQKGKQRDSDDEFTDTGR